MHKPKETGMSKDLKENGQQLSQKDSNLKHYHEQKEMINAAWGLQSLSGATTLEQQLKGLVDRNNQNMSFGFGGGSDVITVGVTKRVSEAPPEVPEVPGNPADTSQESQEQKEKAFNDWYNKEAKILQKVATKRVWHKREWHEIYSKQEIARKKADCEKNEDLKKALSDIGHVSPATLFGLKHMMEGYYTSKKTMVELSKTAGENTAIVLAHLNLSYGKRVAHFYKENKNLHNVDVMRAAHAWIAMNKILDNNKDS